MKTHELKTHPESFRAIWDELKPYEIRKNDRGFEVDDLLWLREWKPDAKSYTGREVLAQVTYLTLGGEWGLPPDICVMGIEVLSVKAKGPRP